MDAEKTYTYWQLRAKVNRVAAMMQSLGVKRGDRVIVYMRMVIVGPGQVRGGQSALRSSAETGISGNG